MVATLFYLSKQCDACVPDINSIFISMNAVFAFVYIYLFFYRRWHGLILCDQMNLIQLLKYSNKSISVKEIVVSPRLFMIAIVSLMYLREIQLDKIEDYCNKIDIINLKIDGKVQMRLPGTISNYSSTTA